MFFGLAISYRLYDIAYMSFSDNIYSLFYTMKKLTYFSSDLPIIPEGLTSEEHYDPNEEIEIGNISLSGDNCCFLKVSEGITLEIHSGTQSQFAQEVVRMTSSSYQSVGDVCGKIILSPNVDQLLKSTTSSNNPNNG